MKIKLGHKYICTLDYPEKNMLVKVIGFHMSNEEIIIQYEVLDPVVSFTNKGDLFSLKGRYFIKFFKEVELD